jgi:predicted NBD/HSP70 family sugar kinase/putative N-acetylmannosamine-6-phosphate epimerase
MKPIPTVCRTLRGRLIVSCQAFEDSALRTSDAMARMAAEAVAGGAAGIRANSPEDIRAIRASVTVPIVGIWKARGEDGQTLITPSFETACELVEAGADMIALDCTRRGQRYGALERVRRIRAELGVPVLADIATVEEAQAAAAAGVDFVLSTMRGYTDETRSVQTFKASFIRALVAAVDVPVIAEGRIETPRQAAEAIAAGAYAVIVGTAITRPRDITRKFAGELARQAQGPVAQPWVAGIDMGGTNTKFGLVSPQNTLCSAAHVSTPAGGRDVLLRHLENVARRCLERGQTEGCAPAALGVATAGWVNPHTGAVVYATENLPGWTGAEVAARLQEAVGLPVVVENDANALAVAEKHFGLAREVDDFICVTLGTGVGGGCYVNGQLNRGAHYFANAIGHILVERNGRPCTCGLRGCLEPYANAAALVDYAGGRFASAEEVIRAARANHPDAVAALQTYAGWLTEGIATLVHLLDPELVILSGGLTENNPQLLECLRAALPPRLLVPERRCLRVEFSQLGYHGGVFGAAGLARERLRN